MKVWIRAALIRAAKTFCQTAIATIGTSTVLVTDVNWAVVLSASALAGILSVLTSVVSGLPEVDMYSIDDIISASDKIPDESQKEFLDTLIDAKIAGGQ